MPVWVWLAFALATARLTVLLTRDEVTRPVREAILQRLDERRASHRTLAYFIECPWCLGAWLSAITAPVAWFWGTHPAVAVPAVALSFSHVAGITSSMGRGE